MKKCHKCGFVHKECLQGYSSILCSGCRTVSHYDKGPRDVDPFAGLDPREEPCAKEDNVNNPSHYESGHGMEVIDVIEEFDLGFPLGNAVKYILRAGKKNDEIEDLKKAIWYIERHIKNNNPKSNDL